MSTVPPLPDGSGTPSGDGNGKVTKKIDVPRTDTPPWLLFPEAPPTGSSGVADSDLILPAPEILVDKPTYIGEVTGGNAVIVWSEGQQKEVQEIFAQDSKTQVLLLFQRDPLKVHEKVGLNDLNVSRVMTLVDIMNPIERAKFNISKGCSNEEAVKIISKNIKREQRRGNVLGLVRNGEGSYLTSSYVNSITIPVDGEFVDLVNFSGELSIASHYKNDRPGFMMDNVEEKELVYLKENEIKGMVVFGTSEFTLGPGSAAHRSRLERQRIEHRERQRIEQERIEQEEARRQEQERIEQEYRERLEQERIEQEERERREEVNKANQNYIDSLPTSQGQIDEQRLDEDPERWGLGYSPSFEATSVPVSRQPIISTPARPGEVQTLPPATATRGEAFKGGTLIDGAAWTIANFPKIATAALAIGAFGYAIPHFLDNEYGFRLDNRILPGLAVLIYTGYHTMLRPKIKEHWPSKDNIRAYLQSNRSLRSTSEGCSLFFPKLLGTLIGGGVLAKADHWALTNPNVLIGAHQTILMGANAFFLMWGAWQVIKSRRRTR